MSSIIDPLSKELLRRIKSSEFPKCHKRNFLRKNQSYEQESASRNNNLAKNLLILQGRTAELCRII